MPVMPFEPAPTFQQSVNQMLKLNQQSSTFFGTSSQNRLVQEMAVEQQKNLMN